MFLCVIFAILFGVLALASLIVTIYNAMDMEGKKATIFGIAAGVLVIAFILVPWNFKTVDNGEVAVVKKMGQVVDVREPGLHSDFWMTNSYVRVDTKVRQVDVTTMSYSNDKQTMDIAMTIQYQVKKEFAKDIIIHYGSLDMLEARIQSIAVERTKSVLSAYKAEEIIQTRSTISSAVATAVEDAVGENFYVDITTISLTNIDFSDAYEQSVEQSMISQQEVIKAQAEAKKAEEIAKGQLEVAKQEAQAKIEAAKADAESKELAAQAEANAIQIKSLEVARMLGLTVINNNGTPDDTSDDFETIKPNLDIKEAELIAEYLKYIEYLSVWDGKLPNTMLGESNGVIVSTPNTTTP